MSQEITTPTAQEPRPRTLTAEMKMDAAREVVDDLIEAGHLQENEREDSVRDIARYFDRGMDGYELAKVLDQRAHWNCDLQMAEDLDVMSNACDARIRKAQQEWFDRVRPEPPCREGARIAAVWGGARITGTVKEIYPYGVAQFAIERDGNAPEDGNPIVDWERVEVLDHGVAAP